MPHEGDRVPTELDRSADLSTARQLAPVLTERGGTGEAIASASARDVVPDLEATRAIRHGDVEARLLQQILLESCRLPDAQPLADDDATRMVRAGAVDEDTTSATHGAVSPGDEETTEQDATAPVVDEATLWTAVGPVDEADPVTAPRAPTFPVAAEPVGPAPVVATASPPPRAPSARVGVRPRHSSIPVPIAAPIARPGTTFPAVAAGARPQLPRVSRRHRRRKLFVALLMGGLFVALFWIAATAPTGASWSPSPAPPPRQTR